MASNEEAKKQAIAQFRSIVDMVKRLRSEDADVAEAAREEINEDALSVEVRTGWHSPGDTEGAKPAQYRILLCTGGPAVQITGDLSEHGEPETASLEYQDWFTLWEAWRPGGRNPGSVEAFLLDYARCFYFGEG